MVIVFVLAVFGHHGHHPHNAHSPHLPHHPDPHHGAHGAYTPPHPAPHPVGHPPPALPPPPPHGGDGKLPPECFIETPCTRSCGDGFKLLLPNPNGYGCYGASLQVHPCNEKPCPIDCHWGAWGPWTQCTVTGKKRRKRSPDSDGEAQSPIPVLLDPHGDPHAPPHPLDPAALLGHPHPHPGGGICTQSRQRVIEVPASYYGKECHGDYAESRYCQSYECRGKVMFVW